MMQIFKYRNLLFWRSVCS